MEKENDNKSKIIKISVLLILFILITGAAAFKNSNISKYVLGLIKQNYKCTLEETINFQSESKITFRTLKDGYIRCTKDGVTYIGEPTWNETYSLNSPVMVYEENITAVTELKNKVAYVFNEKGKMYSIQTEDSIVQIAVNNKGNLAVITNSENKYKINVYSTSGELILSRYENDDYIYPLAVDISNDLNYMAVSYLDTSSEQTNEYVSKILFYSIINEDKYIDNLIPNAAISRNDEIIALLKYMDNGMLIAVSDNTVTAIDNKCDELWKKEFGNQIVSMDLSNSNAIIFGLGEKLLNKESLKKGTAIWYNLSGDKLGEFYSGNTIEKVVSKGNRILIYTDKTIYGFNQKGAKLWQYPVIKDLKQLLISEDLSRVFAVYKNSLDIINTKPENIKEEINTEEGLSDELV